MNEMPVLTPEVPFECDSGNSAPNGKCIKRCLDDNYEDLVPPVLSPALDQHSKTDSGNCFDNKCKNKRKSKVETFSDLDIMSDTLYQFSDNNSNNVFELSLSKSPTKLLKLKPKMNENMTKIKKSKNFFDNRKNSLQKQLEENRKRNQKLLNNKNNSNESNGWTLDSNHTMSSMASTQTAQPFVKYRKSNESLNSFDMDFTESESLLAHNSSIFEKKSLKFKPKLYKKSKTGLNSRTIRPEEEKKSLFNELIGIQKPEPETEEIEGILFQSFETEESIKLFSKFEQLEKEQREQTSISKTYKIKSLKSGKLIFPTKTKDITKIKGWREKLFSSVDDNQTRRPIGLCKPSEKCSKNIYNTCVSDQSIAHTSKFGSKSAFVSDLLDGYLKSKSDLKLNYLSPDFASPPDDSPIFSASVLKMPDFNSSMPPPPTPTSTLSTPNKPKGVFGRSKGLKNKLKLKTDFSDSNDFLDDEEVSNSELLLPQYPVIRETLWTEYPLSDGQLSDLYNQYINQTYHEMQLSKRPIIPSFIMDDHYARFALNTLQCNERIPYISDSPTKNSDNVLAAVGLAPTKPKPLSPVKTPVLSPVKETKITGRYRKDREADLAKIIAIGNRSKRQIRLPSRFHESSLLMGNQWIIPDYDQKGKTGKRRLQQEQKRLQELHQKQLELEQRKQPVLTHDMSTGSPDAYLSLIQKKKTNKVLMKKSQMKSLDIPSVPTHYPLKIPHQRLKQMQLIRDHKNQMKSLKQKSEQRFDKSFTSLYSMSTQTSGDKRILSLSAKAAASATQRAIVNELFQCLSDTIHPDKSSAICRNGKLNKLETMKEAIETIQKLAKREQQLSYIRKLLSMWNHKLVLCSKVAQKDLKPEAHKVVSDVMNTYRNSMCYKVGEALEAKRKELKEQQKRVHPIPKTVAKSSEKKRLVNGSQVINIPNSKSSGLAFKTPNKSPKSGNQRYILPKLSQVLGRPPKWVNESSANSSNTYPKLTTPDLYQKNVSDFDTELVSREGSLLKPPILTTRPTVVKPFIVPPNEGLHSGKSVTGPIINVPNISRIKSMTKSMSICSSGSKSLIASSPKPHLMSTKANTPSNKLLKVPLNNMSASGMSSATTSANTMTPISQPKGSHLYSPHSYAGKSVIIASETPLANEDITKILGSIASNPDFKVPVRLSNGMAALTIPGPIEVPATSNGANHVYSPAIDQ